MRLRTFLSTHSFLWKVAGLAALSAVIGLSALFAVLGPKPLAPKARVDVFKGYGAAQGTFTEQLGEGRVFALEHQSMTGDMENLQLQGVQARLEERDAFWRLVSPAGHRSAGAWTLQGPMGIEAYAPDHNTRLGQGHIPGQGPALRWEKGVWTGLSPLSWRDLQGQGRGLWVLPAGWHREADGRFVVAQGPVTWEATTPGTLRRMQAQRLWLTLGFQQGHLEDVQAQVVGGGIQAGRVEVEPQTLSWFAPVRFQRDDGWQGSAESGSAPRPTETQALDRMEMKAFDARRSIPQGQEWLQAEGVRWTEAGLRLEGHVKWEQPLDGAALTLKAPRVLIREGQGTDLPDDLPLGEARAEGTPVLTWGNRSLSSSRMQVRRADRIWRLDGTVYGKGDQGTFQAGPGQGSPKRWEFRGPIIATVLNGGTLRGDRLLWEADAWTITGRLATWTRLRERLSGARIVRKGDRISFPDGIAGALAAMDGDFKVRADRAEYQGDEVRLEGRVEVIAEERGGGWRLRADRISVRLGQGRTVKQISANGAVTLHGRLGEGRGESLDMDLNPAAPKVQWQGRVKGLAEVAL
ncbi:MAG: LPS export ABC transporter periplasmic protein LptC [Firmicutes bacterium]|nr:LPS export ABC transporter periplasmic protein LptC [Bacillota bacterium]